MIRNLTALIAASLALVACSQTAVPATLPEVTVTAADSGVQAPATAQSGLLAVTLTNTGARPHTIFLLRPKAGHTQAEVQAALNAADEAALYTLADGYGGTMDVAPGTSERVILDLPAGTYLRLDDAADPSAAPVITGTLTVTARSGAAVSEPASDVKVTGTDFAYALPSTIRAGTHMWQFVNAGQEAHELGLVKLHDGKTLADVKAFLDQPNPDFSNAPGDFVGGNIPLSAGVREFTSHTLSAGNYVAVCFIPDPASGKPHFDLGMLTEFTVTP
ncbi:hypothetical protein E7T09_20010 [Deinococcus sp. KSM4-11]|uniref:hypothetical protein n=1 Tax=Deinococcus sp. KSM4-11 TaxID=2568654 RepID=UPI0010A2BEFD|nr:hypothetical protein [Deinococcus sp. KSM4-11]THF84305.1 hypothetical protein E7T09_20010 [Deinococcus sp. KSM4-11]